MSIVNSALTDADEIENVRLGTRKQYISPWVRLKASQETYFAHGLGEPPWTINVCVSEDSNGAYLQPTDDVVVENTDLGLAKPGDYTRGSESTHIRLTSFAGNGPDGNGLYFRVTAM